MRSPKFWAYRSIVSWFLSPIGSAFGYAAALRARCAHSFQINHPVICVGNLVAGGAVRRPSQFQLRTAHSLGYAPREEYGGGIIGPKCVDLEAYRHRGWRRVAPACTSSTHMVSRNRVTGALAAEAAGADVIVMDDGFQNHDQKRISRRHRRRFWHGKREGYAAGPTREFRIKVYRVQSDRSDGSHFRKHFGRLTRKYSNFQSVYILPPTNEIEGSSRVVAFAGIGFPEKFYASLLTAGAEIIETRSFRYYFYSKQDIIKLKSTASKHDANW